MHAAEGHAAQLRHFRSLALVATVATFGLSSPASAQLVISQIYGGGGDNFSIYTNDYIELYNPGASPVTMSNWSVQYAAATGTTWQVTTISGTIQSGKYFLVQEGAGVSLPAGQTCSLPSPNATGTINMSASTGKVALCNNNVALSGADPTTSSIVDFVGYGTSANGREPHTTGTVANNAPILTAVVANYRLNCGAADTNNNAADFNLGFPSPRNSASATNNGLAGIGGASPMYVFAGGTVRLTLTPGLCSNGSLPAGTTVTANLSAIAGSSSQTLLDNGTGGDERSGDGIFSFLATVGAATPPGTYNLPLTFASGSSSGGSYISLLVLPNSAPSNDNAATATPLPGPFPQTASGNFTGATAEFNPLAALATAPTNGTSSRRGVWYTVTGTGNTMTADTCASPLIGVATIPDTVLIVMCGTTDGLTVVANNDNAPALCGSGSGTELRSRASWCSIVGTTYYVWVAPAATGAQTFSFVLTVSDDGIPCSGAVVCSTCALTPAGGAVVEVEPAYGVDTNDGCDTTPNTFVELGARGLGTVNIAGMARGYGSLRDVDWYRLQATVTGQLTASITAQFSGVVEIDQLGPGGACPSTALAVSSSSDRCTAITTSAAVTAGDYFAVRILHAPTPTAFGGVAVGGTSSRYIGAITLTPPPPANDNCASATPIGNGSFAFTNVSATVDGPVPSCQSSFGADIWYLYTAPCSGSVNVGTCGSFDTILTVYPAGICPPTAASQIACNDDNGPLCSGLSSSLTFAATSGTQYLIRIAGFGTNTGSGTLVVNPGLGGGETCALATNVVVTSGAATVAGNNSCATTDGSPASCSTISNDLWWTFTTGSSQAGTWRFNTCGSAIDSVLTVYSGTCGSLTELACNDDAAGGPCAGSMQSFIQLTLAASTQYFVRVASKGVTLGGGITLNFGVPVGACYLPDGTCQVLTQATCVAQSGLYQGDDTTCPASGACCLGNGACRETINVGPFACSLAPPGQGGTYLGDGTNCGTVTYVVSNTANALEDISATGTLLFGGLTNPTTGSLDDGFSSVPLPFAFTFFGTLHPLGASLFVSTNGFATFNSAGATAFANGTIPSTPVPNDAIYALWDDLDLRPQVQLNNGNVYTQSLGLTPNRRFIIEWFQCGKYNGGTQPVDFDTFEMILFEGSNRIEFRYGSIRAESPAGDYTIGVENATGTLATSILGSDVGSGNAARLFQPTGGACAPGACCAPSAFCSIVPQAICVAAGGTWLGEGTTCGANYTASVSPNLFEDITFNGTSVVRDSGNADNGSGSAAIGFAFPFFGITYTSARIGTNGYVTFSGVASDGNVAANVAIPNGAVPNLLLAPLWDDLDITAVGAIKYASLGTSPNRRFVVEWAGVPRHGAVGSSNTFEAILWENGAIELRYGQIDGQPPLTATIGVENVDGSVGVSIDPATLGSGHTARFLLPTAPPCLGACCQPSSTCGITSRINCAGLFLGEGTTCPGGGCPAVGACCGASGNRTCTVTTNLNCTGAGGNYRGDGTTCSPDRCSGLSCSNWIGGTGPWTNPLNWSPNGVPDNLGTHTFCVEIHGLSSHPTIDANANRTIDSLWLDQGFLDATLGDLTIASPSGVLNQGHLTVGTGHSLRAAAGVNFTISGASTPLRLSGGSIISAPGDFITNEINHTIAGGSEINAAMVNNGLILADTFGSTLVISGPGIVNTHSGEIRATNGAIIDIRTTIGGSSGLLVSLGSTIVLTGATAHLDEVEVLPGSPSFLNMLGSSLLDTNVMHITGGTATLTDTATIVSATPLTLNPANATAVAVMSLGAQTTVNAEVDLSNFGASAGTLTGVGTVNGNVVNTSGIVRPGLSGVGTLIINGAYSQASGGTLDLELGGVGAGQSDILAATTASLNGVLKLTTVNGYTPVPGETIALMSTGAQPVGGFSGVVTTNFPLATGAQITVTASGAQATVRSCCDMNCDNSRDGMDIQLFVNVIILGGTRCSNCAGDFNGDNAVTTADVPGFVTCLLAP